VEVIVNTIVEILWSLVSDPHKGKILGACDKLPLSVVFTSRFDFRRG